jgi:hypothetical protein
MEKERKMEVSSIADHVKWLGSDDGQAVILGKYAAMSSKAESENPYPETSPQHAAWLNGYRNWVKMAAFILPVLK